MVDRAGHDPDAVVLVHPVKELKLLGRALLAGHLHPDRVQGFPSHIVTSLPSGS